eukprot:6491506-Amphidinium_carterae.3
MLHYIFTPDAWSVDKWEQNSAQSKIQQGQDLLCPVKPSASSVLDARTVGQLREEVGCQIGPSINKYCCITWVLSSATPEGQERMNTMSVWRDHCCCMSAVRQTHKVAS